MSLAAGTKLGPYEILSLLGAGGMGEVYRARDTRLDRIVAVKILHDHLADRSELRERFEREARTIASLNHPQICTLHDIGHQQGVDFLVMECLEGETLAQKLTRGPLPLEQVFQYAMQIADALDKAHGKGVTHRDLKPGNIMLTKSGVKLLDFGLAKLRQEVSAPAVALSRLPTANDPITAQGTFVGTLQYMAPEQLEGKESDSRTDIFAYGAVVYEMATGKKAFEGKTQASIIAKILQSEPPPISSLQPMTPPALDRVVKKCLAKDPDERWQSARDLHDELRWIAEGGSQTAAFPDAAIKSIGASRRQIFLWSIGCLIVAAVTGLTVWNLKPLPSSTRPVIRAEITLPPGQRLAELDQPALTLSSDGSQLAYIATTIQEGSTQRIYLRAMDSSAEAKPIPGTEGAVDPFFSPDGQWLGFFAAGKLKKVSVNGGVAQSLADAPFPYGGSWGSDGTIIFAPTVGPIQQVPSAGGAVQPLTHLEKGEGFDFSPEFLPGGKAVLFVHGEPIGMAIQALGTGERRNLLQGQRGFMPRYALSGHLIYAQSGSLMAVPFDPQTREVRGTPVPVVQGIAQSSTTGAAQYSFSTAGSLVYIPGSHQVAQSRLVWVSRNGTEQPLAAPVRVYDGPRLSPDGRRVAIDFEENGATQIGLYDLARNTLARFTFEGSESSGPVWTPDGKRIGFVSNEGGQDHVFWKRADGSGGMEQLTTSENEQIPMSWSSNGQFLAMLEISSATGADIWVLRLNDRKALPFLQTPALEEAPQFSPDGRWLAYVSDESGRYEIYVQAYPGPGSKSQISTEGGTEPVWNRNGRELFYRSGDKMMAVEISTQPSFAAGRPRQLFEGRYLRGQYPNANYDVSLDGQRFLMLKPAEQEQGASSQINIVVNWFEELKRRVPPGK